MGALPHLKLRVHASVGSFLKGLEPLHIAHQASGAGVGFRNTLCKFCPQGAQALSRIFLDFVDVKCHLCNEATGFDLNEFFALFLSSAPTDGQGSLCPGDAHIHEAALFFNFRGLNERVCIQVRFILKRQ